MKVSLKPIYPGAPSVAASSLNLVNSALGLLPVAKLAGVVKRVDFNGNMHFYQPGVNEWHIGLPENEMFVSGPDL